MVSDKKDDNRPAKMLGEILVNRGLLQEEHLKKALDVQAEESGLLGEILVKLGYVNERDIVQALTVQHGFPYLPLGNYELDAGLVKLLPEDVARQYNAVPIDVIGDVLTLAMSNPLNEKAREDIETVTSKKIRIFISTVSEIAEALKKLYRQ